MSSHFSNGSETNPRFAFFCAEIYSSVSFWKSEFRFSVFFLVASINSSERG
ncbi:uncharacterized protein METZ01_LOCUS513556 [marine metagenome]|uniref:Uncharacterized protein n=1 Tax=marine metagenome TaxID=408172 RepID=A0A383EUT8_9ZZZZ